MRRMVEFNCISTWLVWAKRDQTGAQYSVIRGSGMTCHGIRATVRHIGFLHLVSILTISPIIYHRSLQSTCHSAPVCEILSKSDHPQQRKMTSRRFSRWRISAILDFRVMGSLKNPCTNSYRSPIDGDTMALNCLVCEKIALFHVGKKSKMADLRHHHVEF